MALGTHFTGWKLRIRNSSNLWKNTVQTWKVMIAPRSAWLALKYYPCVCHGSCLDLHVCVGSVASFKLGHSSFTGLCNFLLYSSESAVWNAHAPPFRISSPLRSPQNLSWSSLRPAADSHQSSNSCTAVYTCQPSQPAHLTLPFATCCPCVCSLHLCLHFCFATKITYTIFPDSPYQH